MHGEQWSPLPCEGWTQDVKVTLQIQWQSYRAPGALYAISTHTHTCARAHTDTLHAHMQANTGAHMQCDMRVYMLSQGSGAVFISAAHKTYPRSHAAYASIGRVPAQRQHPR